MIYNRNTISDSLSNVSPLTLCAVTLLNNKAIPPNPVRTIDAWYETAIVGSFKWLGFSLAIGYSACP
jgi:hypothetical protein